MQQFWLVSAQTLIMIYENSGEETETANEYEENCLPELQTSFFDPCSINYRAKIKFSM